MVKRRGGVKKSQRKGITQSALAGKLGVNARQVRELTARGMPRHPDGSYPEREAIEWYVEFRIEDGLKRQPRGGAEDPAENSLVYREQNARVLLAELKLRREEGRLVTTVKHRERVATLSQQYAAVIRSLPQYAPELVGIETMPDVTVILERIANQMLDLARGDYDAVAEVEAPAEEAEE